MRTFFTFLMVAALAVNNSSINAQSLNINGPAGSLEFGKSVKVLTNGNYVISDPSFSDGAISYAGAVYLYNGRTHALISRLTGSGNFDVIGSGGITPLSNGDFVVSSPKWHNGIIRDAGAVTLVNAVTGLSGVVSSSNSLIGSTESDQVGFGLGMSNGVIPLSNGKYLVHTPDWDKGLIENVGAVTFVNGSSGPTGEISSSNSLIGSLKDVQIGSSGIKILTNGSYVICSPHWYTGEKYYVGAITWGNGNTGIKGEVDSSNSLVGSRSDDYVGNYVTILSNGNYVSCAPIWDNGSIIDAGAVTWCNGSTGKTGEIDSLNSLVGIKTEGQVGLDGGAYALTNGHYVLLSPYWNNGTKQNVGAITWGNGNTGITGVITTANSLVGTTAGDLVGYGIEGIVPLTNGNYIVTTINWHNGSGVKVGAVTWVNGSGPVSGVVDSSNSLLGSKSGDIVGFGGITALSNGNYVVNSHNWADGIKTKVGAVTWGNGNTGISGYVSSSNSLIGSTAKDAVGISGVTALTNGNFLVSSQDWHNGVVASAGAITWCNGNSGITGVVSSSNSLVGTSLNDLVGQIKSIVLANGNYVVGTPLWDNGSLKDAGFATWGNGNTGITGEVNSSNSLVGINDLEKLGSNGIIALANGNYVVNTHNWDNVAAQLPNQGAVTWGNGSTGVTGEINQSNSLFGYYTNDAIGSDGINVFSNGSYAVLSPLWNNGSIIDGGAITLGNGSTSLTGLITNCNSVLGYSPNNGKYMASAYNYVYDYMIVSRPSENIVTIYNPKAVTLAISLDAVNVFINGNNSVPLITNSDCRIIASLLPNGSSAVNGFLEAKVWVETSIPSYLGKPFVARHFQITPAANASTASGRSTLYFSQQEFTDFNAHAGSTLNLPVDADDASGKSNLKIRKYSGISNDGSGLPGTYSASAIVIDPNDEDIVWNSAQSRWEVSFDVKGFSGFIVETSSATLPLTLLEFNGKLQNQNAVLNWKTENEQNSSLFQIERSIDATNYSFIGNVKAANTAGVHHYVFTDYNRSTLGVPVVYYRLKEIEIDGRFVYSKILALSVENKNRLLLYPNPAINEVNLVVTSKKREQVQLKIIDNVGRVLKQRQVNLLIGSTSLSMDLSGLFKGMYYLELKGKTIYERRSFVKQQAY